MKFAWTSDHVAFPTRCPFSPTASMSRPAWSPGGETLARVLLRRIEDHFVLTPGLPRRLWTWMLGDRRVRMLGLEPGAPLRSWELAALRKVGGAVGPSLLDLGVRMKLGGRAPTYTATPPPR